MDSALNGDAMAGALVRVDRVREIRGEKLRAHICEPPECEGWTTSQTLTCKSGNCG
jgi:hypothetical protein